MPGVGTRAQKPREQEALLIHYLEYYAGSIIALTFTDLLIM